MTPNTTYKRYLLLFLTVTLTFNFVDRTILSVVLQDIKVELSLTDTQLGFLSGIAFALFYSAMGIPIARWADRGDRVTIITVTTAAWSLMVVLCGMVMNFAQLLLVRVGVAVGEAGCIPPAHSLIADNFSRAERPRAAAIYTLGGPLAYFIGYVLAGWINEVYGWRATFMMLGAPGLVLAVLAHFSLREPRRSLKHMSPDTVAPQTIMQVSRILLSNRTFRNLVVSFSMIFFFGYGITLWQPSLFVRSYGLSTGEIGTWFAVIYGVGGLAGTYLGGVMASRFAAHNEGLQLRAIALANAAYGVLSLFAYLSADKNVAFSLLAAAAVCGFSIYGPLFSTIQTLVPDNTRAMAIALMYFFANLIGMGLGPLATGALSDAVAPWAGDESLRYALLILCPGYSFGAFYLWRASRTVTQDIAIARAADESRASLPVQSTATDGGGDGRSGIQLEGN